MAMQINSIVSPSKTKSTLGFTPMDVGIEISVKKNGKFAHPLLLPLESDDKTRKRLWLPDLPRSSNTSPILGSDKLDYYHSQLKPKNSKAMLELLQEHRDEISELQLIIDWMQSGKPSELEEQISDSDLKAGDKKKILSARIVFRLDDGIYIHDLKKIKSAHKELTLKRVKGVGQGELRGALNRIHSKKMPVPLLGCNDEMFCAWGQTADNVLNISASDAVNASQKYTELLEAPGHNIRMGDGRFWVWGALPAMAEISKASEDLAMYFDSDEAVKNDPVGTLTDIINAVDQGAKSREKIPDELKIACAYISIGGSGKGRAAIGQMTEFSALKFLKNLLLFHELQRRQLKFSNPYWKFGYLTVAEGSSKQAVYRANEQIFEAMIDGKKPPQGVTKSIIHRMKIEGVPNLKAKKSNREWAQISYLAWLAPDFIEIKKGDRRMKPDTTPENLLAWHVGRVFAACKTMSYHYASRGGILDPKWRDPVDSYRQTLFSSPSRGFAQVITKVSPYLAARPDKSPWFDKTLAELGVDCPNSYPPKRWTDEQTFFLALGISQYQGAKHTAIADNHVTSSDYESKIQNENSLTINRSNHE